MLIFRLFQLLVFSLERRFFAQEEHKTHFPCLDCDFVSGGTHITGDICFLGGGTHFTRDMCFLGGGTHIASDICFLGRETYH